MKRNKNVILILFGVSFVIVLAVSFYANSLVSFSMRTMEYNIEQRLISVSKRLADMVSVEELDQYRTVEDMELPSYQALRRQLLGFSHQSDVVYAYFIRPVDNKMQFIVDNDFDSKTRVGLDTKPFDPQSLPWILSVLEGQAVCAGLGNYSPDWDGLLSGYAPVFDRHGRIKAIAGVDIEDKAIVQVRRLVSILNVVQVIAVIVIFISGIISLSVFIRERNIYKDMSIADALTGIYNRRFLDENLERIIKSLSRSGGKLSLLIMDIDYFKKYNDTYGHNMGDSCLKTMANTIAQSISRADDFVARYGGEEFVIVLPNIDEQGAETIARRVLDNVRERNIPHEKSDVASVVTVSIGGITGPVFHSHTGVDFIKRADQALYESKQSGRNRYTAGTWACDTAG